MAGFDPKKYLAEKQADQADASSTGGGFDPKQYLQSKGIQTLPDNGGIQDGATAAETYRKFGNVASSNAALGAGNQLNAGLQSAMGAVDQVTNGSDNFGNQSAPDAGIAQRTQDAISNLSSNYSRAKQGLKEENNATRAAHPVASALTEIGAGIAPTIAASGGLSALGLTNPIAQAGAIGTSLGYGGSDKTGLGAVGDAVKSGALAAGTAGALQLAGKALSAVKNTKFEDYIKSEYGDYSSPVKDIAEMTSKPTDYGLDLKVKNSDAFKLGQEYKTALTNPATQLQITQELNQQPQAISDLIKKTKGDLSPKWDAALKENGAAPTDLSDAFKTTYNKVQSLFTEGNEAASRLKDAFNNQVKTVEDSLLAKSPTGTLKDVPLSAVADAQQQLGDIVFSQKAFQSNNAVNGAAKQFFGNLAKAFNLTDETVGSGGELSNINKVYKSMYEMEDRIPSGARIKALTDPQAVAAHSKWTEFVEPFQKLDPQVRDVLAPEMHDYLANQFPKTLAKAKTMLLATERGPQAAFAGKQLLSLAGLRNITSSAIANIANRAGVVSASPVVQGTANSLSQLGNGYKAIAPTLAPALGALTTQNQQSQGSPALSQLK